MSSKFVFVTGGVVSSLGKGIAAASIGCLLEARGLRVSMVKLDPYLNVDPGTLSPYQHGEVFVTDDGAETDLDLGHYERFTHAHLGRDNNYTSGRIYEQIIQKERRGDYLGKTVQVVPHVTDEIKGAMLRAAAGVNGQPEADVTIVEIGGTIGDIESLPFLEAIRQMRQDLGRANTVFVHLTLVPWIAAAQELKTKPTQHTVRELLSIGIQADILLCRSERPIPREMRQKIAQFCNVEERAVIGAVDVPSVYEIPTRFAEEGLDKLIVDHLRLDATTEADLDRWYHLVESIRAIKKSAEMQAAGEDAKAVSERIDYPPVETVSIAIVGKYTGYEDCYKSLKEALTHAAVSENTHLEISWVEAEELEAPARSVADHRARVEERLKGFDGILVPGGFGNRGIEGMIEAIRYARENRVPFFGICLGMQTASIEFARNVCGLEGANSSEFAPAARHRVILKLRELLGVEEIGGTMRLGAWPCRLEPGSLAFRVYDEKTEISERHRHRYEFNREYEAQLTAAGLRISGASEDRKYVEMVEIPKHPYFIACQFHPEFKSKPLEPHPLFVGFIGACRNRRAGLPEASLAETTASVF